MNLHISKKYSKRYLISCILLLTSLITQTSFAQPIVVAQIGPFTGLPTPDPLNFHQGAKAYFDSVNAAGGVSGRVIDFFKLDDNYRAEEFTRQLDVVTERKAIALMGPVGAPGIDALLKPGEIDKRRFVIIDAIPGSDIYRTPGHPRFFHIRASDSKQINKLLKNAHTIGIRKIHVIYENTSSSIAAFNITKELALPLEIQIKGVEAKNEPGALSVASESVVKDGSNAVFISGAPKYIADNVVALRKAGMNGWIFSRDYLSNSLLVRIAGVKAARGVGISQTFPNPNGHSLPIQKAFQTAMADFAPEVKAFTSTHLEGYISARVLVEGLKRAGTSNLNNVEKLTAALKTIKDLNIGGFTIDFSRSNSGSNFVDIGVITDEGKLRY